MLDILLDGPPEEVQLEKRQREFHFREIKLKLSGVVKQLLSERFWSGDRNPSGKLPTISRFLSCTVPVILTDHNLAQYGPVEFAPPCHTPLKKASFPSPQWACAAAVRANEKLPPGSVPGGSACVLPCGGGVSLSEAATWHHQRGPESCTGESLHQCNLPGVTPLLAPSFPLSPPHSPPPSLQDPQKLFFLTARVHQALGELLSEDATSPPAQRHVILDSVASFASCHLLGPLLMWQRLIGGEGKAGGPEGQIWGDSPLYWALALSARVRLLRGKWAGPMRDCQVAPSEAEVAARDILLSLLAVGTTGVNSLPGGALGLKVEDLLEASEVNSPPKLPCLNSTLSP